MPEPKKTVRKPSAYNIHMGECLAKLKAAAKKDNKEYVHRDAFTACAAAWATSPKNPKATKGVAKSVKKSVAKSTRK